MKSIGKYNKTTMIVFTVVVICVVSVMTVKLPYWKVNPFNWQKMAFIRSIAAGDNSRVEHNLVRSPLLANFRLPDGTTPIRVAILYKRADTLEILLIHGADPNAVSGSKDTPLHLVAFVGDGTTVFPLVRHGAILEALDRKGRTPLVAAVEARSNSVVDALLKSGANPNTPHFGKSTLLHHTASLGDVPLCRMLIRAGANPDAQDEWGNTPYDCAQYSGNSELLEVLRVSKGNK